MNGEQTGFVRFINQIQMASFGTFNSQVLWFFGSLVLTLADAYLLTRQAEAIPWNLAGDSLKVANGVAIFTAHNTGAEQMRQVGVYLAGILIFGWTGKSVAGFFSGKNVRETAAEYAPVAEAKARGKAAGALDAERIRQVVTAEHQASKPRTTVRARKADELTVTSGAEPDGAE
jgi:hypothetical protein